MTGPDLLEFMAIDTWDGHLKHLGNWLYANLDWMTSMYCRGLMR